MSVVAQPEQSEIDVFPGGGCGRTIRRSKQRAQSRLVGCGCDDGIIFAMDAMDVRRGDRHVIEQRLARHSVVAVRVARGHASLIAPQDMDARPVHTRHEWLKRQQLVRAPRRRSARECDHEFPSCVDRVLRSRNESFGSRSGKRSTV